MSKTITRENLLSTFPEFLARDTKQMALAVGVADELMRIYNDDDLVSLYARIDELPEDLLDILAWDFKIDWWDANYSLQEKRETFKGCWHVHRKLGTKSAMETAVSAIYENVQILEWWEYEGNPYRFRLLIDTGEIFVDFDKLIRILDRVKFYKNLRSILEKVICKTEKRAHIYAGMALQNGTASTLEVAGVDPDDYSWYVDESDNYLIEENGILLFY